eukprot:c16368_g1_i1 orf=385-1059(+)
MLKRVLKRKKTVGVPLYLNVYDLTPVNGYLYWFGLGIYHSAVEAHGVEYAFGAHDFPSSGVFELEPRSCPGFQFRRTIKLGTIQLSSKDFRDFMVQIASEYSGNTYHLMVKNCNHFCNDVSTRLTGSSIPGWVNRLAKLGNLCTCFLPNSLHVSAVKDTPDNGDATSRSRRRSIGLRFADHSATMPPRKRCRTVSSSFLKPLKGGAFPWNWKTSTLDSQKFRQL